MKPYSRTEKTDCKHNQIAPTRFENETPFIVFKKSSAAARVYEQNLYGCGEGHPNKIVDDVSISAMNSNCVSIELAFSKYA